METNTIPSGELHDKAVALLEAAYAFWRVHQRECGHSAVVWLRDDEGKLVVFTRGEYRETLLRNIDEVITERPLE